MEVMEFKNGCTASCPEDVQAIFASAKDGGDKLEGFVKGDPRTVCNMILQMAEKCYKDLTDDDKVQFTEAVIAMIQRNPAKNMTLNTVKIVRGVKPEADND